MVVLAYLTLDLSLASMPGAFVFEPDQSIETTQNGRARAADVLAGSVQPTGLVAAVIAEPSVTLGSIRSRDAVSARFRPRVVSPAGRPRTVVDAPSPEDPH